MNEKKLAANRQNALKSTGPKSRVGKSLSSRNAVKHGLLTAAPILRGVESRKVWERHRDDLIESIEPVGYLEKILTIRLAEISWRLGRVVRYEAEVSTAALARAESDLDERDGKPSDPAEAQEESRKASLIIRTLEALFESSDQTSVDAESAVVTVRALWEETHETKWAVHVPGIPEDRAEFNAFDQWTAGLLRKAAELFAPEAQTTAEALLFSCIQSAYQNRKTAEAEESWIVEEGQRWTLVLEQENCIRKLLDPDVLNKVTRYESNLERSFFRILHEIQRLQAARLGAAVPPPAAIDVDLTVHQEIPIK
jgi:hypothetical protein